VELATLFLRLGATAFGGPAAHIAMMEDEVVRRRHWLTHERFLDMLGATNVIPGPNSTEMAIHLGYDRAGLAGVIVAGGSFILPAASITLLLAWAYVRFGTMPQANAILYGAKPAIIAIVFQALWRLGRTALRSKFLALAGLGALAACAVGINELIVLFATGGIVAAIVILRDRPQQNAPRLSVLTPLLPFGAASSAVATSAAFSLSALFLFFFKVGAVLFGIEVRQIVGAATVIRYDTRFTPGGFQVPSPAGRIDGGVSFGQ
jgi:chromate transporter